MGLFKRDKTLRCPACNAPVKFVEHCDYGFGAVVDNYKCTNPECAIEYQSFAPITKVQTKYLIPRDKR